MKTLNSLKPNTAKVEIISFILLVLLFAALFFYWQQETKLADAAQQEKIIPPSEHGVNALTKHHTDTVDFPLPIQISAEPPALSAEKPYAEQALINPPLPVYVVKNQTTMVNANTGEVISTNRKSRIEIPARAFVDAKGKVVEGKVKVDYREYHDFHDIFLSGIPMHYENGMLESAGMIEINASQNGEQVYVNPENKIRVMLTSAYKSPDYNLYYLDQKEKKWKVKGKDEVVLADAEKVKTKKAPSVDSTEQKFTFSPRLYSIRIVCVSDMRDRKKNFLSKKKSPDIFDFRFGKTNRMLPELKEFYGLTWRYKGDDAQQVFLDLFGWDEMKRSKFSPTDFTGVVSIAPDADGGPDKFRVTLTSGEMTISIPVAPVFYTKGAKQNFDKRIEKYNAAVANRIVGERSRFEQFKKDTADYFAANGRYVKSTFKAETVALRTFQVDNFGVWNVDKYFTSERTSIVAKFVDENGKSIFVQKGFLVEKTRNSIFTVNNLSDFRFNPKAVNLFWAILPGNKLAVVYPHEFVRHNNDRDGVTTFVMKVSDTALLSAASLKAALSFN